MSEPVDVKAAVKNALEHFKAIYDGPSYEDLSLEEVQLEGNVWQITLGYSVPTRTHVLAATPYREYKTVSIDGAQGNFISMKIRRP